MEANRAELIVERAGFNIYLRDAALLVHTTPPDPEGAVVALEDGRAQAQRAALNLDTLDPFQIHDPVARRRANTFISARERWREAQQAKKRPFPDNLTLADAKGIEIERGLRFEGHRLRDHHEARTEVGEDAGHVLDLTLFVAGYPRPTAVSASASRVFPRKRAGAVPRDRHGEYDVEERLAIEVRDAVAADNLPGPTIVAAGRAICMTGGHGWFLGREADGEIDVRKAVREQRRDGADCIKFIATGGVLTKGAVPGIDQLTEEEMRAAVTEARTHGLRVAAPAIGTTSSPSSTKRGLVNGTLVAAK